MTKQRFVVVLQKKKQKKKWEKKETCFLNDYAVP